MTAYDVVVIGAGHNGLVAAAYLGKAGKKVLVLEGRDAIGGTTVTEDIGAGFKASPLYDLCGLLLPRVVRDLSLGRHGLELRSIDPAVGVPLPDGGSLSIWRDPERTLGEIARHSKKDALAYPRFADLLCRVTASLRPLLSRPAPRPTAGDTANRLELVRIGWGLRRMGTKPMLELMRVLPMSVADWLSEWFESDGLKAVLAARGISTVFLSPRASGSAAVFLYHHLGAADGPLLSWGFPTGGIGSISHALGAAATAHGVEIRTGAAVERVLTRNGRAVGVALANGEEIAARVIVSNAAPRTTFLELVDPGELDTHFLTRVKHIRYRGIVAKVNLGLSELPRFAGLSGKEGARLRGLIQIGPGVDYLERAFDDAKYGRLSREPFLQVVFPSLFDARLAPKGQHLMSVLVQYAPYDLRQGHWSETKETLIDTVVATLAEYAPNVKRAVTHRQAVTPMDLESRYGLPEGNPHQGDLALDQLFFMRPVPGWARYRTPIENLYLCGAATHPGGGVTGAPGYNASREILKDWSGRSRAR